MKHLGRILVGICGLLLLVSACGGSSSRSKDPSASPRASVQITASGVPTPPPARVSVSASPPPSTGGAAGAPQQIQQQTATSYWGTDGRHYWQDSAGAWHYDLYTTVENTASGPVFHTLSSTTNQELYTFSVYQGWVLYKDPGNPLFIDAGGYVKWVAWPAGQSATDANLQFVLVDRYFGTEAWFTAAKIAQISQSWSGGEWGIPNDSQLPTDTSHIFANENATADTWAQPNCARAGDCVPLGS